MIIHLQLCSITHLGCELPSICLLAEDKTHLEKKWVRSEYQDGVNLKGKTTRGGGMLGVENMGTGGERRNVVNAEKAENH